MPWQYKIFTSCLNFCQFFVMYCEPTVFLEGLIPVSLRHVARVYQHLSKHQIFSSKIWDFCDPKFLRHTTQNTDFHSFPCFCSYAENPAQRHVESAQKFSQGLVMSHCHRFSHRTNTENMTWFSSSINFLYFCYITLLFLLRGDKGFCTWQSKWSVCLDYSLRGQDFLDLDYHSLRRNPRHKNLHSLPSNGHLSSEKYRKKSIRR